MLVPIEPLLCVSVCKLEEATYELGVGKAVVVVQVEEDFVGCHRLEVHEVFDGCGLVAQAMEWCLRRPDLDLHRAVHERLLATQSWRHLHLFPLTYNPEPAPALCTLGSPRSSHSKRSCWCHSQQHLRVEAKPGNADSHHGLRLDLRSHELLMYKSLRVQHLCE